MPEYRNTGQDFLQKITEIIEDNISNEQFGVAQLAGKTGMSRSNLLRKVKKLSGLSVSQFIRQVRLKQAMELLRETSLTTSETSYRTGFSSLSYFIKCFREYYGYPPGEAVKRWSKEEEKGPLPDDTDFVAPEVKDKSRFLTRGASVILASILGVMLLGVSIYYSLIHEGDENLPNEKSIAVLPFKNDSNDSTNVYIINGLMDAILNNLQKVEDLRVISRTSTEKYRHQNKSITEIAEELDVQYCVEGSGQKSGNQLLLNIQLIDARSDKHLLSRQYKRDANHIFELQNDVAKSIADEIEVIVTPAEAARMEKRPTDDLVAYDWFLKGRHLLETGDRNNIQQSVECFRKAIAVDVEFARAYAATGIAFYFLDQNQAEKQFSDSISFYSDRAMFFDPHLPQSLISKGLYYMETGEYVLAEPYFEKALEYSPNNDLAIMFLINLYVNYLPNTQKYLEYALRGLELDLSDYDSTVASFNYLHISNAFIQNGFVGEAVKFINKSLDYKPDNLYSEYTRAYILYAQNRNLNQTRDLLQETLQKDTNRVDVLQEVAKIYYYQKDFETAYHYYKKYNALKTALKMDIYPAENGRIGYVYAEMGQEEKAQEYLDAFRKYAEKDQSVYKHANLALYYSYQNNVEEALRHFRLFAKEDHFHLWTILFFDKDPLAENLKKTHEFKKFFRQVEKTFYEQHEKMKMELMEEGVL
ncbi:helix-turn-helix domain-containing protein [Marinilabilia rubra]|uniref:AraC family transcriptional regulator n=1 Tax=Marinilabilia rubra TaxID=2162893 RepID=A0A2U2B485_9BACT|nr:helix-turn-helix domain-containing protein [Marinilabilia rubra]PWD97869.1 AraC family transcriptional regulator [Marinilabilia rubra]